MLEFKNMSQNKEKQIKNLIQFGTGASSNSILEKYINFSIGYYYYPCDYSDFMRCANIVSIFDIDISIMKDSNPIWSDIVDNWKSLIEMSDSENKEGVNKLLKSIRIDNGKNI